VALAAAGTVHAHAGDSPTTPYIIGGRPVAAAPWAVQMNGGCSGSIIGPRWVLSAWHCYEDDPGSARSVRVGDVRLGRGQVANIKQIHHRYDILLVELDRDIVTTYATVADADPPEGAPVDIYGWGGTCESGCGLSDVLKTARMRVRSVSNGDDGSREINLEQTGDGYAWFGDSGGPAFWNGMQIGTLCCGNTSGDGSGTESYHSLNNVRDWIREISGIGAGGAGPGTPTNLALNRPTTASAPCNPQETSAKAVNGSVTGGLADKWCSAAGDTKTLEVDLGAERRVRQVVVRHAGAGAESASLNTRAFTIGTSTGGGVWQTVATVNGNTASDTTHPVTATARWVRLTTTDPVARIYEFEVYD
jgi:hypothetical protein